MAKPESFDADPDAWAAWRPEEVALLLANVQTPWYVAGGWAIDLFLGGQRRRRVTASPESIGGMTSNGEHTGWERGHTWQQSKQTTG